MTGSAVIEVWVPDAATVDIWWLQSPSAPADPGSFHRAPMEPGRGGWWTWQGPVSATDYCFVIDGSDLRLPDPRSAWQPFGVHGPSRTFDPHAFAWTDSGWRGTRCGAGVLGGAIYELHVGTFTAAGTLDAATERLDHLVALGVDVVELMPVMAFDGDRGWGYDQVAPYSVHAAYGGPRALQRFVDAAHARGLAVCLDVVHNHLGPSGNYLARFGPYFTDTHETPWGSAVNLDTEGSAQVRGYLIDSVVRWFRDFHVDALRLDAVHQLRDDSSRHFLAELSDAVAGLARHLGRPLDLIAESDLNDVAMVAPTGEGGLGMTAQWDDDVHHALHVLLTGEEHGYYGDFAGGRDLPQDDAFEVFEEVVTHGFLHAGTHSTFRGSVWGKPIEHPDRFDARRLVAYLQTHDQIGNRARGDRIHHGLTPARHALGAALYLLGPFTPMLFMGEEWGASTPWQFFTSFDDDLGDLVAAGRRAEFAGHGWAAPDIPDPQACATFERSRLRWAEVSEPDHERMLSWYAACLRLRRERLTGPTRLGDVTVTHDAASGAVTMTHRDLTVAGVLGREAGTVRVPRGQVLLSWAAHARTIAPDVAVDVPLPGAGSGSGAASVEVVIPPTEVVILVKEPAGDLRRASG